MRKKEKLEIFNISRNVEIYLSANDFDGILSLLLENLFWRIIEKLVSKIGCYHNSQTRLSFISSNEICVSSYWDLTWKKADVRSEKPVCNYRLSTCKLY